jgi:hypothetical protein
MFGQKYTDRYPDISKDVNYTAVKYSSIANGIKAKVWQPLEGLQFMASRKKIVESVEWALEHSESVLLDIIRKAHKEVSRLRNLGLQSKCLAKFPGLCSTSDTCAFRPLSV